MTRSRKPVRIVLDTSLGQVEGIPILSVADAVDRLPVGGRG